MIPDTPTTGVWRPLIRRLVAGLAAAMLVIGVLAVIVIRTQEALDQSNAASRKSTAAAMQAQAAAVAAQHAIDCVNTTLAARAAVTATDNQAHIQFAEALLTVLSVPSTATPAQQQAAVKTFITALGTYVHTLVIDQQYRDDHPLGRC